MGELERSGQNTSAYCLAWTAIQRISRCPQQVLHALCRILGWTRSLSRTPHFQRSAWCDRELRAAPVSTGDPDRDTLCACTNLPGRYAFGTGLNTHSRRTGCCNKR